MGLRVSFGVLMPGSLPLPTGLETQRLDLGLGVGVGVPPGDSPCLHYTMWMCEGLSCTLSNGIVFPRKVLGVSSGLRLRSVLISSASRGPFVNPALGPSSSPVRAQNSPCVPPGQPKATHSQEPLSARKPSSHPGPWSVPRPRPTGLKSVKRTI